MYLSIFTYLYMCKPGPSHTHTYLHIYKYIYTLPHIIKKTPFSIFDCVSIGYVLVIFWKYDMRNVDLFILS